MEEERETTTTTTTATTTTTTTTTTTALPIGQTKRLTVNNLTPGLSVQMDFKQGNDGVYIHAAVSSSGESLYRICLPEHENRPKIYMVEGFSDCSAITSQETVNAKLIATLDNPSKCTIINLWYFFCTKQTETWKIYNLNRVIMKTESRSSKDQNLSSKQ